MKHLSRILLSVALCASACSKKDNKAPAPEPKTTVTPTPAAAEPKASTVTVDPEIRRMVKEIVDKCQIDDNQYVSCNGNEAYAFMDYAVQKKLTNTFESLAEIALTDGAKDPKVLGAVAGTWNYFSDRDMQKQNATPAAAERVLKLYPQVKSSQFGSAASIPLIAGKRADLTAVLQKLPDDSPVKAGSIREYLDWGGIAALPDVQAFAKSSDDGIRAAAAGSVAAAIGGTVAPHQVADADKTQMCDWVKTLAADAATPTNSQAFANAIESLGRCKGAYIDAALADIEGRLAKEKLIDPVATSLHHMCWAEGLVGGTPNGTKEQCVKSFSILEKAMSDKDVQPAALQSGLIAAEFLSKNSPDVKPKAIALVTKFTSNKDKDLAKFAKDTLGRMK